MERLFARAFSSSPPPHECVGEEEEEEEELRCADTRGYCELSSASSDLSSSAGATNAVFSGNAEYETGGKSSLNSGFKDGDATTMDSRWATAIGAGELSSATSQRHPNVGLQAVLDLNVDIGSETHIYDNVLLSGAEEALISARNDDRDASKRAPDEAALSAADWLDVTHAMLDGTCPDLDIS